MNTTSIIIHSFFICYDIVCLVLLVTILCILYKYIGKSNKEIVFYKEKYIIMYIFFVVHISYQTYYLFEDNIDNNIIQKTINTIYLYFFDYYLMILYLLNLFISLFIYRNIQDPSHLLIEVIKQPKRIKYEIIILISCIIKFGLNYIKYHENNNPSKIIQIVCIGAISLITYIYIHFSKKMLRLYSFNFKYKFTSILTSNRIINIPYTLLFIIVLIQFIIEINPTIYRIVLNFWVITSHLCDCILFLFQIYLSDSYYFLISKSSKIKCFFCLFKKTHPNIHKMPLISNSDVDYKLSVSFLNSTLISNENIKESTHRKEIKFEQLGEFLQKNKYSINSYYIELLDFIINTSIVAIAKIMTDNKINENEENEENEDNNKDIYVTFTKKNKHNDFQNSHNLNKILELNEFKCDYNLKIKQNFSRNINEIINNRKIHIDDIIHSLLSHHEKDESECIYQNRSLLIKNILEENFKQMKGLSLRTTDKRLYIDILSNHNSQIKQNKLEFFINNYLDYINENNDSFLPIVLGMFNVRVNDFNELIFILTSNSLNQNTPINNINNYYSTYNVAFPIIQNTNNKHKDKFKIKNEFNKWKCIIEKDLHFLCKSNISSFELEGLYYRAKTKEVNNDEIIRREDQDDDNIKEKVLNFVKGNVYNVQNGKSIHNMHFQFKNIFDLDSMAFFNKCNCYCGSLEKYLSYKNELIHLFQYENKKQ